MYLDLFESMKELAMRYERYCDKPGVRTLQECIAAHQRALDRLDRGVASEIDPLISQQMKAGNAARGKALEILNLANVEQRRREQFLGARVGFPEREIEELRDRARAALNGRGKPLPIADTRQIRMILIRLHDQVRQAFNSSQSEARKTKKAHRSDAREYVRLQLWMVGAIIVNAEHRNLFHVSYATSVGMSMVQTISRKAVVTRTYDRPHSAELDDAADSG
jgi:hypothetical protein